MSATAEEWRELRTLLEQALELPASEREAFVARVGSGERAEQLRRWIALDARTGLAEPPSFDVLAAQERPVPQRLGPYECARELSRDSGWIRLLATRADGEFDRLVTIELHAEAADQLELAAFHARCSELEQLDHPSIPILYDSGIDSEGRPWLAFESLELRSLDDALAAEEFDARERVGLAIELCSAIAHANAQCVIHGELDASRIAFDSEGRARILGLHLEAIPSTVREDRSDWYAPERRAGAPASLASEVFGLGQLIRRICASEDTSSTLARRIEGLTAACTRSEPDARPTTAEHVTRELRAIADRRPSTLFSTTLAERFQLWLVRQPVLAVATIALALLTVASGGQLVWRGSQARASERSERSAELELQDTLSRQRATAEQLELSEAAAQAELAAAREAANSARENEARARSARERLATNLEQQATHADESLLRMADAFTRLPATSKARLRFLQVAHDWLVELDEVDTLSAVRGESSQVTRTTILLHGQDLLAELENRPGNPTALADLRSWLDAASRQTR